jgi:hypothetical protein
MNLPSSRHRSDHLPPDTRIGGVTYGLDREITYRWHVGHEAHVTTWAETAQVADTTGERGRPGDE